MGTVATFARGALRRWAGIGLALATLAVGAAVVRPRQGGRAAGGGDGGRASAETTNASVVVVAPPGASRTYELVYESVAGSDMGSLLSGPSRKATPRQEVKTTVRSTVVATVVDAGVDAFTLAWEIRDVDVRVERGSGGVAGGKGAPPPRDASMERELRMPFFIRYTPRGALQELSAAPGLASRALGVVAALASQLQATLPERQGDAEWRAVEHDGSGTYAVLYRAVGRPSPAGAPWVLRRSDKQYRGPQASPRHLATGGARQEPGVRAETSSRIDVSVTAPHLLSLDAFEEQSFSASTAVIARSRSTFALTARGASHSDPDEHRRLVAARGAAVAQPLPFAERSGPIVTARPDTDGLVRRLEGEKATLEPRQLAPLRLEAIHAVAADPAAAARFGRVLAENTAESLAYRVALAGLVHQGGPEAQRVLVGAVGGARDKGESVTLVGQLADVAHPTKETVAALEHLARGAGPTRVAAVLSLGAAASHLASDDPAQASAIVHDAIEALRTTPSPAERSLLWGLLGNARSPETIDLARERLPLADADERARIATALRFVDRLEAEDLLMTLLGTDRAEGVRLAAADALGRGRPAEGTRRQLLGRLPLEPSATVRAALLRLLWSLRDEDGTIRPRVEVASRQDPSAEVRNLARLLLASA